MNDSYVYYQALVKPAWAPPSWLFGPVWTLLYVGIALSFGSVFVRVVSGKIPVSIALPFILNLVFNLIFTPIQFWLRSNMLATLDILLILSTLIWAFIAISPYMKWVVYVNLPYLGWVVFACALQITITYLNK